MAEPDAAACNWTCTLQPERRLAACFSIPNAEYQRLDLLCAWQISGRYFFIRWFLLGILMVCMHRSHDHKVFHPLEVPQELCPRVWLFGWNLASARDRTGRLLPIVLEQQVAGEEEGKYFP